MSTSASRQAACCSVGWRLRINVRLRESILSGNCLRRRRFEPGKASRISRYYCWPVNTTGWSIRGAHMIWPDTGTARSWYIRRQDTICRWMIPSGLCGSAGDGSKRLTGIRIQARIAGVYQRRRGTEGRFQSPNFALSPVNSMMSLRLIGAWACAS